MGLSLKSIGKVAKKAFTGVKKVASVANPLAGALYDAVGGKSGKEILHNVGDNYKTGLKAAAIAAPIALTAGAAAPAVGGVSGAAAGAAGAASKMGTLGKIANSPLTPALLDFAGSTIAGIGQGKQASEDRGEERRQFDLNYALKKHDADLADQDRQRKLAQYDAAAPMRQGILQMVAQRLGIPPEKLAAMTPPGAGAAPPSPPGVNAGQPPMVLSQPKAPVPGPQSLAPSGRPGAPDPQQLQSILARMRQLF